MTSPQLPQSLRLDDLITGINQTRDGELDRLAGAVLAAQHLGDLADHLVGHYVDQARRAGRSWTEIGASMGVTKQAVRKRFNPKDPGPPTPDPQDGFAAFTQDARDAIVQAQEEARAAGAAHISADHILLAVVKQDGSVVRSAITAQGTTADAVAAAVAGSLPAPSPDPVPDLIPYDEGARKVLELTFREALRLEHAFIGTEHVLLALVETGNGHGLSKTELEASLVELMELTLED